MNPTNIAVVSSGASLASAVTATSFLDGEGSTHLDAVDDIDDEEEEEEMVVVDNDNEVGSAQCADGDVEDEGVEEELHDESASSK